MAPRAGEGRWTLLGWRPSRGLRTTAWWATVTVLVLMVVNNIAHRRSSAMSSAMAGAGNLRPAVVRIHSDEDQHPTTASKAGGHSHSDPTHPDPEDAVGHGDEHAGHHGPPPPTDQPAAEDVHAAGNAVPKGWSPAGISADAELLQRGLLEHFAAREAARPAAGKACFTALVRHTGEGLHRFVRLLGNVKEQLPGMARRYPFVAFFEAHVDKVHIHAQLEEMAGFKPGTKVGGDYPLAHVFPAGIIIAVLDEHDFGRVPDFVPDAHTWPYSAHNYWGVPYRHMCRFFGVRVMLQPALAAFDHYMRLDTDSFLLAPSRSTEVVPARVMPWDRANRFPIGGDGAVAAGEGGGGAGASGGGGGGAAASSALDVLGLEEREVEVDLFHEMAARGSVYGFNMVHPQTMREFMIGLFETYDGFVRKEVADHHVKPGDASLPFRDGGVGDRDTASGARHGSGPTPFKSPRGLGLHFWDNFEIIDLRLFRPKPRTPIRPMVLETADDDANLGGAGGGGGGGADGGGGGQADDVAAAPGAKAHLERAQSVLRWLSTVDQAAGFYTHRWGDAEVRTLTMTLFLQQSEFLFFDALAYQHYHNYHCPTAANDGREDGASAREREAKRQAEGGAEVVPPPADSEALIAALATEFRDVLKSTDATRESVIARHDAVDALLRRLSPGRARVDAATRADCAEEAHKSYGRNSKGPGGAEMHPAEHSPNNHFIWAQQWPQV